MKLIFAQGNPGTKFDHTRHNVGFMVVDDLAKQASSSFALNKKFLAHMAEFSVDGEKVILAKPQTFYNETGRSFQAIKQFYRLENEDILIVHDELALPFGTIRSRIGGSDAGNNGIKSINMSDGDTTARLRIGIGNELRSLIGDTDFVLAKFTKKEVESLTQTILPKCIDIVQQFVANDHTVTSHTLVEKTPKIV